MKTPTTKFLRILPALALCGVLLSAPAMAQRTPAIDPDDRNLDAVLEEKAPAYFERIHDLRVTAMSLTASSDMDLFSEFCADKFGADDHAGRARFDTYIARGKADEALQGLRNKVLANEERRKNEILIELYNDVGYQFTREADFIAVMEDKMAPQTAEDKAILRKTALESGIWDRKDCINASMPNARTSTPFGLQARMLKIDAQMKKETNPVYAKNVEELLK